MKNKEKYFDEIVDEVAKKGSCEFVKEYVYKGSPCGEYCDDCTKHVKEWLEQEYQEPITLTNDEKVILKNLPSDIKWIARDKSERLFLYFKEPRKALTWWNSEWVEYDFSPYDHLFKFIKWEDEDPYNIDELLKQNGVERNEE